MIGNVGFAGIKVKRETAKVANLGKNGCFNGVEKTDHDPLTS